MNDSIAVLLAALLVTLGGGLGWLLRLAVVRREAPTPSVPAPTPSVISPGVESLVESRAAAERLDEAVSTPDPNRRRAELAELANRRRP